MKYIPYLIFFILLSAFAVAADPFIVDVTAEKAMISEGETAYYLLTVTNKWSPDSFLLSFPSADWITRTDPLSDYHFSLGRRDNKTVRVSITPKKGLANGPYGVPVSIKRVGSDDLIKITLPIQLGKSDPKEYLPIVRFDVDLKYENDPREDVKLNLFLENLNYRNLTSLHVVVKSALFEESRTISLNPKEQRTENFVFDVDDVQIPIMGKVSVTVSTEAGEKEYSWAKSQEFKITGYSSLIKNSRIETGFLKTIQYIEIKNDGNIIHEYEITHPTSFFKKLFSDESPHASVLKSPEGKYLVWNLPLEPQEEKTITIVTDYRYLAGFILALLVAVLFYFIFRPPIVIKKEVSHIGTSEGGISDIKVIVYIKNRTNKIIEDIAIIEKVPHIANIGKDFQVGTIKPTKVIQNAKRGTLVKWELQSLEAYEERIITYKIKSKLSILGGLTLPATVIKYTRRGKTRKTKSNRLVLEI